ncbi:hypothetical protein, partial [Salmonella sp. s51228]|uniref:hypothetical protein n=1 Tax=Salmonella sp. s51228 TaxID=3159652 RepID=UPI0039803DFA
MNKQLLIDFYSKRTFILEQAKTSLLELLSDKTNIKNQDLIEQHFETEWDCWLTDLKLSVQEKPSGNFIFLLTKEIEFLITNFKATNEERVTIGLFFEYFRVNNILPQFVIGDAHYKIIDS